MKRILFIALMLASFASFAQPQFGGQVGGYDNSGTKKFLMFNGNQGKFWDSTANVYNLAQKLKLDSIYTKINSTIAVTMSGHDSTTDSRVGVKLLQNPTITNTSFGISGTLPGFASTPTVNIGTTGTIPVSGTFWQATQPVSLASVPSHAVTNIGTFPVQVDSSLQRSTFKISQLPLLPAFASTPTFNIGTGGYAVSASDSNKYRIGIKVLESALPVGASTESTLSTLNGKVPSGLTVNSNRLAIYAPDSIRVFATNGFGSGGGGGGDASAANQVTGNTLLQKIRTADSTIDLTTDAILGSVSVIESTSANIQTSVDNISTWADNNVLPRVTDSTVIPFDGVNVYGQVRTNAPSLTDGKSGLLSLTDKGGLRVTLTDLAGAYVAAGGGGGSGGGATALRDSTSTATALTMTGISSLASSATVGWQSDRISNLSTKAIDYKIMVRLSCANTSPANDKAIYAYLIPWWTSDGGTTWYSSSIGTTTLPTGSAGGMTIAAPHNLRLLGVLNYTTADMIVQDNFLMSNAYGDNMPDAFSIGIINFSGAALDATSGVNNLISYTPIFKTNR